MRFTNNFNLLKTLQNGSRRLVRIFTMPVYGIYRRAMKVINPNGIMARVMSDVRKGFKKLIGERPSSLKDYFVFPRHYVAKKLVFIMVLLALILPVLYLQFLHPIVRSHFLTATMYVNAAEMTGYTGKVKLLSPKTDKLIYQGPLQQGRVTGNGVLYDHDSQLVYKGGFELEMYEGEGELYYPEGGLQYRGGFHKNKFHGMGTLYSERNTIKYEGEFKNGEYEGRGKLYYDNSQLFFEGDFAKGQPDGSGTIYNAEGMKVYEGDLKGGKFEGKGTVYENGEVLYKGELSDSRMNGRGTIYSGELIIYEGEFVDGFYEGPGKSYDPVTGTLIYDGNFEKGKYSGEGKLFDPSGGLVYEGGFYNNNYEGNGKLFDPFTEYPLYEGGFRAGRYDGSGMEYSQDNGSLVYEGEFLLGFYNGKGVLHDPYGGDILEQGIYQNGMLILAKNVEGDLPEPGIGDEPGIVPGEGDGSGIGNQDGSGTGDGTGTGNGSGTGGDGNSSGGNGNSGGSGQNGGKLVYSGPKTEDDGVDYAALASLTLSKAQEAFSQSATVWELDEGNVMVYEDSTEKIGLTLHEGKKGTLDGVDVWNDAEVGGVSTGMTLEEISGILGEPKSVKEEVMGEGRMVSVSQSNRYTGRLSNLSVDSRVTVAKFDYGKKTLSAVFAPGVEGALILEIR